jgi:hypothetical protein
VTFSPAKGRSGAGDISGCDASAPALRDPSVGYVIAAGPDAGLADGTVTSSITSIGSG